MKHLHSAYLIWHMSDQNNWVCASDSEFLDHDYVECSPDFDTCPLATAQEGRHIFISQWNALWQEMSTGIEPRSNENQNEASHKHGSDINTNSVLRLTKFIQVSRGPIRLGHITAHVCAIGRNVKGIPPLQLPNNKVQITMLQWVRKEQMYGNNQRASASDGNTRRWDYYSSAPKYVLQVLVFMQDSWWFHVTIPNFFVLILGSFQHFLCP